ncbi:hypothetical protein C8F04DRAFT_1201832 [Mycena alexandri]|uniref:Uncharacterized protein n=1 Tax=Mycena alexandri TaxID=1745969 RepID=A0AAD6WLA5_9AGAR|nr:hypothetical protein C8F04DRAFT_1201832 [Mycena alexandri]
MPKTPKTPTKARPKPRPLNSPKKKHISAAFVNDEADESDDGVLVDPASLQFPDFPAGSQQVEADADEEQAIDSLDEYEQDFINDGSPPSSPSKRRARPSPDADRSTRSDKVIELEDTSDEDLAAMDVDDSMFRKPAGVKASALPPSLVTRSAAAKRGAEQPSATASVGSSRKRSKVDKVNTDVAESDTPAFVNGQMNPAMVAFVAQLLSQQAESIQAGSAVGSSKTPPSDKKTSRAGASSRVDHDELALRAGIRSSLSSPLSLSKPSLTNKTALTRDSPEWDEWTPPPVSDVLDNIKTERDREAVPSSPKPKASKGKQKAVSSSPSKGKGKDRSSSPIPDLEDITSDYDQPAPSQNKPRSTTKATSRVMSSSAKTQVERTPSEEPKPDNSLAGFLVNLGYPLVSNLDGVAADGPTLTMAQFQRVARGDASESIEEVEEDANTGEEVDTVFLEDIEVYRAYFNPKAKCGVFDIRLQAMSLRPTYLSLHPLPANRRILASYDRNRSSLEDIDYSTGGRINWESWYNQNPRMLAANSIGAIVFAEAAPNYCNLSRVSPLRLNTRISAGSSSTYRLHIDDRIAICVSVICTTESHLVAPKRIGVKSERMRKWVSGVMHDQEWERFEANVCLQFHEQIMYSQIVDKAISFQTMISPDPRNSQDSTPADQRHQRSVPSAMFSQPSPGKKSGPSRPSGNFGSSTKTLLAYNDSVPVYDARRTVVDFNKDLPRLDEVLPLFPGEVPVGSYTVVGYTLSSYTATLSGTSNRVPHVGCNVLWAIVCGTPSASGSRS